jgi:hypothetical protein
MTSASPGEQGMTGHDLLLHLAGRIPDELLADTRRRLADGDVSGAMAGLTRRLAEEPVALLAGELTAIRALAAGRRALAGVELAAGQPEPPFAFNPLDPAGRVERDATDQAVAAVAEGHGAAGVWRSWRYGLDERAAAGAATVTVDPDDPGQAHRVYIVQVWDSVSQALCRDLLRAIADTGCASAEVITLSDEPPPYQVMALAESLLLWASQDEKEFALAPVFDFVDPVSGPGFAPDHAAIEDRLERERLLDYLRGGGLILATTATTDDILDLAAGAVVPASFRTDGEWIWTDAAEYYLSRHRLAPDRRLTAHIRQRLAGGEATALVDDETAGRAADFLLNSGPAGQESP